MIFATITYNNQKSTTDGGGTTYNTADVYIGIVDENGAPVNGNNAVVTVQITYLTASPDHTDYVLPGMSRLIYQGLISRGNNGIIFDSKSFSIFNVTPAGAALPLTCDAHINSVTIDKKESDTGAADGQVTVNAFSSYGPIMYSLDNVTFQASAIFTGLTGGGYNATITDANGCTAYAAFNLPSAKNLLISDPSVSFINSNVSRWNAAFNPVVFTYQRKDVEVTGIFDYTGTATPGTLITVIGYTGGIKPSDAVYVKAGPYAGVYDVVAAQDSGVVIDAPYIGTSAVTGFMNSNTLCSYYQIKTFITYQDTVSGGTKTITSTNRPDSSGIVQADLSSFLQSLLRVKDDSGYTAISFRDSNLSASYNVAYQESWTDALGSDHQSDVVTIAHPYFVTYTAQQLGQRYGGNMAQYIPFKTAATPTERAKWITDFAEPAYSPGYPFDIGFIYSEDMVGLNPYFEFTLLNVNRAPLTGGPAAGYLQQQNQAYLLNADSSKFIIANGTAVNTAVSIAPDLLGLNRLLINPALVYQARYINLVLKYDDGTDTHELTQVQTIRIDDAVDDQSVYLRWIGLTGSWNYYRFVYNQEVSLDVQNAVIIKNFVADWENQQGIEEVISKSAGEKMRVMAEDLSIADIKGLQSVKYSPKVQMLVNRDPVKWQTVVLNTATFAEYETRYGQYAFSVTFNLPGKNVQSQ